jgi:predicted RecB family nuclease
MKIVDSIPIFSATDLVGYLNCQALTGFDRAVANGDLAAPKSWNPLLEVLWERGTLHEEEYVKHLQELGLEVIVIEGVEVNAEAVAQTRAAMEAGADIIVQAALAHEAWIGRADILHKVEGPSNLGSWAYEPLDTKLSRETKAGSVLQLCLYAYLLEVVQGNAPELMGIVMPWSGFEREVHRFSDYAAYFRFVMGSFEKYMASDTDAPYPEPKSHCEICRWRNSCDLRRRGDDHLSLVANLAKSQISELHTQGITTLEALATTPVPLPFSPARGSILSFEKAREQARVQLEARNSGEPVFERLPAEEGVGLSLLPEPSDADIFLDFEGDSFVGEHGLEYLTGYVSQDDAGAWQHHALWAFGRADERANFEAFVDFVMARWEANPELHIYHYAPYEPAALKRLMGRYGSRENEIDRMLRAGLFVDLYAVVRNGIRAGVESYSIKKLEPLFGYVREKSMDTANLALSRLQANLELGQPGEIPQSIKDDVEAYNKDDCLATLALRDWLEQIRANAIEGGDTIDRPPPGDGDASEDLSEWIQRVNALMARITERLPEDVEAWNDEHYGRWVLANTLDFHRREQKAVWWEFFRLKELTTEELLDERAGLSGLTFVGAVGGTDRAPIHRYSFVPQEYDVRDGDDLIQEGGDKLGKVDQIQSESGLIDIKKRQDSRDAHPAAVFAHTVVRPQPIPDALMALGEYVADHGLEGDGDYQAARDLLMRLRPRGVDFPLIQAGEETLDAAKRLVCAMPNGILPMQGPPGSGKTYTGSRMICDLVAQGKTVGITANSHKVIRNMLDGVVKASREVGIDFQCIQKVGEIPDAADGISFTKDNTQMLGALGAAAKVGGATAWFWSREDARNCVDVLFVDEAAQMALANVLAISGAAKTVVLLGDPQQLDQPVQGSHPEGTDISALGHLLNGEETIPDDQGLFLEETWRLHPSICAFTSDLFYAGKLEAREHNARQSITSEGPVNGAGLWYLPVAHDGNVNASPEEASAIADLINRILEGSPTWTDRENQTHPLTLDDILVITPYNAQVFEIQQRIPNIKVGTVDKFQGQEAPIAIYSTATSTQAEAPRGMEFLYNLNRFNVATSRAMCACILVSSPSLMEADCRTPKQMRLANAFCRYRELAKEIAV